MKTIEIRNSDNAAQRFYNNKLVKAYQKAYASYQSSCDRYVRLLQAYNVLTKFKKGVPAGDLPGDSPVRIPHTEKIMRQMIEEAYVEKKVIAEHARECIRHMRKLKYEM